MAALSSLARALTSTKARIRPRRATRSTSPPGTLAELAERYATAPPKGEIVIVVGPPPQREASEKDVDTALRESLATLSPSRAAADVADRLGIPRKRVYARALELSR